MSYKLQLKKGRAVEREHLDFYHEIKKKDKLPSDKKFTEGIAKAHISENPKYYDILSKSKDKKCQIVSEKMAKKYPEFSESERKEMILRYL